MQNFQEYFDNQATSIGWNLSFSGFKKPLKFGYYLIKGKTPPQPPSEIIYLFRAFSYRLLYLVRTQECCFLTPLFINKWQNLQSNYFFIAFAHRLLYLVNTTSVLNHVDLQSMILQLRIIINIFD